MIGNDEIKVYCLVKHSNVMIIIQKEDVVIQHVILVMPDNWVLQAYLVLLFVLLPLEVLVLSRLLGIARHLSLGPLEYP